MLNANQAQLHASIATETPINFHFLPYSSAKSADVLPEPSFYTPL